MGLGKRVTIPVGHRPAMRVPVGGSSCANCQFYARSGGRYGSCTSRDYQAYYGTRLIPCPPREFCSDWYEPAVTLPPC